MWATRWLSAFIPAALIFWTIGASLGVLFGGAVAGALLGLAFLVTGAFVWLSMAFVPWRGALTLWGAQEDRLLERSWFRAFDEQGVVPPPSPRFFISAEPAPVLLLLLMGRGGHVIILSRSWLSSRSEAEIRESFRVAALRLKDDRLRWRTAQAWFFSALARRIPSGVWGSLWGERGGATASVLDWVISLPVLAWLLWVQRSLGGAVAGGGRGLPQDSSRHAAASLLAVEPLDQTKTILSSSPGDW